MKRKRTEQEMVNDIYGELTFCYSPRFPVTIEDLSRTVDVPLQLVKEVVINDFKRGGLAVMRQQGQSDAYIFLYDDDGKCLRFIKYEEDVHFYNYKDDALSMNETYEEAKDKLMNCFSAISDYRSAVMVKKLAKMTSTSIKSAKKFLSVLFKEGKAVKITRLGFADRYYYRTKPWYMD